MKFRKMYFGSRTSQELREKILVRTLSISRHWRRKEGVWNTQFTHLRKWDSIATEMVGHFEETGHPVLKGTGVLSGGILKRQDGRCTIHFNGDSSNTDRLFAQFTQQSSSVSTEQFQAGVKSSLNGPRIKKSRLWRSSRQKKMISSWQMCAAARSEFFCASSKERQSGIWKQIARMSSEIWNTRQRNSIYESLWICDIPEKGLYRDELQNYSWRRWWFWRSNLSLLRIHTPSWRSKFRIFATSPGQPVMGQFLQVHITRYLDITGIEIQIPYRKSWVVLCRGKNRCVEEVKFWFAWGHRIG